ncbi:MAG: hypothetical protein Q4E78_05545 [Eubacteriales bacterium]|nr:hypothetical protein [Eubacteriales bacterium]
MVELFEQNIRTNTRQSSKGNQLKWENEGIWYKADYTGYEGLAEYVISHLLKLTNLNEDEYVLYEQEQIKYKRQIYNGVKSRTFIDEDWQIITLERLFKNVYNESLTNVLWHMSDVKERLEFLVNSVKNITGLNNFGEYICRLFTIDAFFLNEDRHMHNIAVLMNGKGRYKYCPVFDNGAGLLSDTTMDYPMGQDTYQMISEVKSKSVSQDFDEQLDVAENLYGQNLHFLFTKKNVSDIVNNADMYPLEERKRVELIIYSQMNKYQYLFR